MLLRGSALALLAGLAFWAPAEQGESENAEPPTAIPAESQERGNLNIPLKTLGGLQLWSDERVHSQWRIQRHSLTEHCRLLDPDDTRRAWGTYEECESELARFQSAGRIDRPSTDTVILLHGIWGAKEEMRPLETALRATGREAFSINYASTQDSINNHAAQLARIIHRLEGAERISFVTHSMGGLIVRRYMETSNDPRIHRLVMIAPPNRGAQLAVWMDRAKLLKPIFGPAGPELRSDQMGIQACLPIPSCEFGVIAGGKENGRGFNPLLEGDNDMTVEVENTKLDGMADFLVVPSTHYYLMKQEETIAATLQFLETGRFSGGEE